MSNNPYVEFAKLFKERENPNLMTVCTGKVLSPLPDIQVQLGDSIILTSEDMVISASLIQGYIDESEIVNVKMKLNNGDEVILITTADKQMYYVIDKVGAV
ncbi:DUF2577 domain-containing protein [Paenibacillus sp. J5C_2022]|uniref:DUF2577 domain-containing protein n=1 Tax=Paenibacillus sp. J5C2022 TaxID=2977129 RepID=UPI0021D1B19A|nr:DUF2577 domain-containing protein [Paenibacillus sp. J5C2022]MCU6709396.1 DUF2577 domain-containing protein [Paenibacillus sp. J5C2022]